MSTNVTVDQVPSLNDEKLRHLVAALRGYKLYEGNGRYGRYVFCLPFVDEYTEGELARFWNTVRAYATPDEAISGPDVPDWPQSLDDALALITGADFHAFELSGFHDFGWAARLTDHEETEYIGHARYPARAVTVAWVRWKLHTSPQ